MPTPLLIDDIRCLISLGWDTYALADEFECPEAEIWNCLARAPPKARVIPPTKEMPRMAQPRYDSRVKIRASEDGDSVGGYWQGIKEMVSASEDALIAVYGPNCWAKHEYIIAPEGLAFMQGAVNQYVRTPSLP